MPRQSKGVHLQLYGPDSMRGAKPRRGFTRYVWYILYQEGGRQRERSTGTGDLREAEGALGEFTQTRDAEHERNSPRDPNVFLIVDALSLYAEHHGPGVSGRETLANNCQALAEWWGELTVDKITAATCRRYAREAKCVDRVRKDKTIRTGGKKAAGTVRRELGVLRSAVEWCRTEGYLLGEAPVVVLPDAPKGKDVWLDRSAAAKLLRAAWKRKEAGLYLTDFILIGIYMGARKEAILSLQWQPNTAGGWIDLERGVIDFMPVGRAQTKKRRATSPIPNRLLARLRRIRARTRQFVIEAEGQPIKNIRKSFESACADAGLDDVTPHTLRHTAVSWLMQDGHPAWKVGGFVGMSEKMVNDRYGHHAPEHMQDIAQSRRGR